MWPPWGVYFMALDSRFMRTWRRRPSSPRMRSCSTPTTSTVKVCSLASVCWRIMASTAATVPDRAKGAWAKVVLPASIFDMSSTSLMSPSRCWPEVAILRL